MFAAELQVSKSAADMIGLVAFLCLLALIALIIGISCYRYYMGYKKEETLQAQGRNAVETKRLEVEMAKLAEKQVNGRNSEDYDKLVESYDKVAKAIERQTQAMERFVYASEKLDELVAAQQKWEKVVKSL